LSGMDKGHAPSLKTEGNWILAGEIVFDAAIVYDGITTATDVRQPDWYSKTGVHLASDGTMPFYRYCYPPKRKSGTRQTSLLGVSHSRNGRRYNGQGRAGQFLSFDRARSYAFGRDDSNRRRSMLLKGACLRAPWLRPDPIARLAQMSVDQISAAHDEIPPGVVARHRSSLFYPTQVPDLIGVRDRHYLDRTGLQQHRSIVDLMRYAALNQGGDDLASYNGFVPLDNPKFSRLPEPSDPRVGGRYSDEQTLCPGALPIFTSNLRSTRIDLTGLPLAQEGVRTRRCAACHALPLGTNNKLTPAEGFVIPEDHLKRYDVLPVAVGTDSRLTLRTRRGTGYYKVRRSRAFGIGACFHTMDLVQR